MMDEEELIQENIQNLDSSDIPIVSYFGSGSSLLGSILIKLGMDYIEGYQERVIGNEKETQIVNPFWRNHWIILDEKYNSTLTKPLRFFKAHHYPESFEKSKIQKAVLLVRDGRDAALSYYNWRVGFVKDKRTFDEFLRTNSYFKRKPFEDWALFCKEWNDWGQKHSLHVITFEELKFNPHKSIKDLLNFVGITCPDEEIRKSIAQTGFQVMRAQEDKNCDAGQSSRIFRKGLIGEWREIYSPEQLNLIPEEAAHWLNAFGYNHQHGKIFAVDLTIITKEERKKSLWESLESLDPSVKIKIIGNSFNVRDLSESLGKVTINHTDHFEITRSVDLVCRLHNLKHIILPEEADVISEIKKLIAMGALPAL